MSLLLLFNSSGGGGGGHVVTPAPISMQMGLLTPAIRQTHRLTPAPISLRLSLATPLVRVMPAGSNEGGYRVLVVDRSGVQQGEVVQATVGPIHKVGRNGVWDSATVEFPTDEEYAIYAKEEVQIWRNGRLMMWGVALDPETVGSVVRVSLVGLEWYFDQLNIGKADRENLCLNPSFEDPLGVEWGFFDSIGDSQFYRDSTYHALGLWSLRIDTGLADEVVYAYQQLLNYPSTAVGTAIIVAAWGRLDSSNWFGSAFEDAGLKAYRFEAGGGPLLQEENAEITEEGAEFDHFLRYKVTVNMPRNVVEDIEWRLNGVGGSINWDAVVVVIMESLYLGPADVADVFAAIAAHLQDPAYDFADLNIAVRVRPTGRIIDQAFQFADHHPGLETMKNLAKREGFEFRMRYTDTERWFETYSPDATTYRGDMLLDFNTPECRFVRHADRTTQEANSVIQLGDAEGADREEGAARVAGEVPVLQAVVRAPTGADIDTLDQRAAEYLATHYDADAFEVELTGELAERAMGYGAPMLASGDTVPLRGVVGRYIDAQVTARIVDLTITGDTVRLVLNPPEYAP